MAKFFKGDIVTTDSGLRDYTVAAQIQGIVYVEETPFPFQAENLRHVKPQELVDAHVIDNMLAKVFQEVDEEEPTVTNDTWQFTVTSEDAIQYCEICKELTYAEPLAFLTYNDEHFCVVHKSLTDKASKCKGSGKIKLMIEEAVVSYTNCPDGTVLELEGIKSRKAIKAWAKAVKMAPWKKSYRKRGLVTVTKVAV